MTQQQTPAALAVGKALTAQGLISLIDAVSTERSEAGRAPRMALVDAFLSLDFQSGKGTFQAARKLATERAGGETQTPTHKRLSEAHAIFTAIRMAGVEAGQLDGLGWQPSVDYARGALEAAGLTVAGNPRKSEEERDAERAARETDAVNAMAIETLPPNATPEQIAEALSKARAERAESSANKTVPESIIRVAKMLGEMGADLDALAGAAAEGRKAWDNLPGNVRDAIETLSNAGTVLIPFATDLAAVREQAKEQQAAQRKAEAELKAQKAVSRHIQAAA
jgi:hypothetical protein